MKQGPEVTAHCVWQTIAQDMAAIHWWERAEGLGRGREGGYHLYRQLMLGKPTEEDGPLITSPSRDGSDLKPEQSLKQWWESMLAFSDWTLSNRKGQLGKQSVVKLVKQGDVQ